MQLFLGKQQQLEATVSLLLLVTFAAVPGQSTGRSSSTHETLHLVNQVHHAAAAAASGTRKLLQEAGAPQPHLTTSSSSVTASAAAAPADTTDAEGSDSDWVPSLLLKPPSWVKAASTVVAMDVNCPGCVSGYCFNTDQGYRCTSCEGSLFVSRSDGTCGECVVW